MLVRGVIGALACAACALPALAQDAYVIGLTGALTGPPSTPMLLRSRRCASTWAA